MANQCASSVTCASGSSPGQIRILEYYNQAIKLEPNYAPAYAHMARAYFFLAFFGTLPPQEGWRKVKEAATLAVEKDDILAERSWSPGTGEVAL